MIDILLAAYNGEKFLKEQVDSIFSQTCKNWQLLIRDDGSTDATIQIIKSYIEKYPDKIRLIEDNLGNLGVAQNFGTILQQSKSEYIMFCDQDDVWLPEKIELTLNKMKESENLYPDIPILIFTDLKVVDENLNIIAESLWSHHKIDPQRGSLLKNLTYCNIVTGCTVMINRKVKEFIFPIPEYVRIHDRWIALIVAKYGKLFLIPAATILYRQHPANVIGSKKEPMTLAVFMKKLKRFLKESRNDYKIAKKIWPKTNPLKYLIKSLLNSIQRRI